MKKKRGQKNMIHFESDYTEGAHENILLRLSETNMEQSSGYGMDPHCENARNYIKKLCKSNNADVHFLVGGTQTNLTVIAAALRPYQGVLAADSGHINTHETGAIEASGHKVLSFPGSRGKLSAAQIEHACLSHIQDGSHEHMVQPKMVYISSPTELGTLYSKAEMTAIHEVCRKYGLYLFLDGARMGYGLMAKGNDMQLPDYAELCDVFYIGGTKVGALFGEAVVICNEELKNDFRYMIKQRGGMLAKGRLLGIQFEVLFENGLYFDISAHAVHMAELLREAFVKKGFSFFIDNPTNQIFPILPDHALEKLSGEFVYNYWERVDENHSAVRFCTSWATKEENVQKLIAAIYAL